MRIYKAVKENLSSFHKLFHEYLLPIQLKYGARLVGRWETEDARVIAVWEYDSLEDYERIERAVRNAPDSIIAQQYRQSLGQLFIEREETFMVSTIER
jgi:hypothetical protein